MKGIEERILKDGVIIDNDILKVDSFLNHQIDVSFLQDFAKNIKEALGETRVDRILTIETSGVAVAFAVAEAFGNVPLVFAKKQKSRTVDGNVYRTQVESFTHGNVATVTVSNRYLLPGENVLLVDDFLAAGNASVGLIDLCRQAGANPVGLAVVIEKLFQGGRALVEKEGVPVFAGASIKAFKDNKPVF